MRQRRRTVHPGVAVCQRLAVSHLTSLQRLAGEYRQAGWAVTGCRLVETRECYFYASKPNTCLGYLPVEEHGYPFSRESVQKRVESRTPDPMAIILVTRNNCG